jgi:hypothetical protein
MNKIQIPLNVTIIDAYIIFLFLSPPFFCWLMLSFNSSLPQLGLKGFVADVVTIKLHLSG